MIPILPAPEVVKSLELQETNNNILTKVEKSINGLVTALTEKQKRDEFQNQETDRERPKASNKNRNSTKPSVNFDFSEAGLLMLATKILNKTAAAVLMAGVATELGLDTVARIPFMLEKVTSSIKSLYTGVKTLLPSAEGLFALGLRFPKIADAINTIGAKVKSFFSVFLKIGNVIGKLPGVGSLMRMAQPFMSAVSGLGRALFGPITMTIFALIDFVKGALDGYDKEGIFGAIKGGIIGVFNGFISKPLDLLKDLVSWSTEKLGFKNFAGILDSFSFETLATDLLGGIFNLGKETVTGGVKLASMAAITIPDVLSDFGGWYSKNVMEPTDNVLKTMVSFGDNLDVWIPENISDLGAWLGTNVVNPIGNKLSSAITTSEDFITNAPRNILNFAESFTGSVLVPMANDLANNVKSSVLTIPEKLNDFGSWFGSNVLNPIGSLIDSNITPADKKYLSSVVSALNFPKLFTDKILTPVIDAFFSVLPSTEDIKKMFADFKVADIFTEISTAIKNLVKNMIASVLPEGKWFDGIRSMIGIDAPTTKPKLQVQDDLGLKRLDDEILSDTLKTIIGNIENKKIVGELSGKLKMSSSGLATNSGDVRVYNDNRQYNSSSSSSSNSGSGSSGTTTTRASRPSWKD